MMAGDVGLLRELCLAPAPSGFEAAVQRVVRERLAPVGEASLDPLGDLWLAAGPEGGLRVTVAAHADQIGLIVTFVEEQGYLRVDKIGGVAVPLVPGREFVVHGARGPVRAVSGRAPTHLTKEADRDKTPPMHEQFLDIGATSRAQALERVAVGDAVTFAPSFVELTPGVVATQALDDRAGVYVAVRALELYAAGPGEARLTALCTVQEETTLMGAKAAALRAGADVFIVVDGDFCSDTPAADARRLAGEVKLGGGPVLGRGAGSSHALLELALDTAAREGLPVQVKAAPEDTYTDADELMAGGPAATLSLSLPVRYMHSPFEVAHLDDLEAAAHLTAALARRLGGPEGAALMGRTS
jgi:putative aminopeptidase FrvX